MHIAGPRSCWATSSGPTTPTRGRTAATSSISCSPWRRSSGSTPRGRRDAEFVALLHDVGKIRIPKELINKPGALTPEERALIETHAAEGEKMLARVGGLLGQVGKIVRSHHEHFDGTGVPGRAGR